MARNDDLNKAKDAKNDEFYTQLTDIEKEMRHYRKHFEGKTIFCNCDDPFESNFFKYFVLRFNKLKIKKLIATCYTGSPIANRELSLFDVLGNKDEVKNKPYKAIVSTVYDITGDGGIDMFDIAELFKTGENKLEELKGDGDFRSNECLELMEQSDIVVTNPPFSLFREYIAILMAHHKKFIIIGNLNAITYKEFFPLLKNNEVWIGASIHSGDRAFYVPDDYPLDAAGCGIDEETGRKYIRVKGVRWYTNLDIKQRHDELILVKRYSEEAYIKYDNYDAIDIGAISDIPCDYQGIMGVPVTLLDSYNPDQFEIIGFGKGELAKSIGVKRNYRGRCDLAYTKANGKKFCPFGRILIRNKHPESLRG